MFGSSGLPIGNLHSRKSGKYQHLLDMHRHILTIIHNNNGDSYVNNWAGLVRQLIPV